MLQGFPSLPAESKDIEKTNVDGRNWFRKLWYIPLPPSQHLRKRRGDTHIVFPANSKAHPCAIFVVVDELPVYQPSSLREFPILLLAWYEGSASPLAIFLFLHLFLARRSPSSVQNCRHKAGGGFDDELLKFGPKVRASGAGTHYNSGPGVHTGPNAGGSRALTNRTLQ